MAAADRNLLFGLLALQNGLIDQVQLVAAFQAWTRDKDHDLAEHLEARGDLDADQCGVVEAMVVLHIKKHGSTRDSLAAIPAGRSTRESLAQLGDPDIEATLSHVNSGSNGQDADDDRTASYAVGTAASRGQRFRVLRPHARGGLGAVFVAVDEELHREVALKQILDQYADDPTSRQRFLREAEITGGLEHPGIVPVYGLGTYDDGRPYYAMRFVRGDSLKEAISRFHADAATGRDPGRRSLELNKLLRRFLDVCNAIDYAHTRGVLHRDIKPSNIILGPHGETLVGDWGLAKPFGRADLEAGSDERLLVAGSGGGSAETQAGTAIGTPAYMSPEQAAGDLDRLGPASDIYSLGATLYYLLTDRAPFEDQDIRRVLARIQKGEFPPPHRIRPGVPAELEAICLRAMERRPEDRFPSAMSMAESIEAWLADMRYRQEQQQALGEARRLSARLLLDRGLMTCQQGDTLRGLLWLSRGLQENPTEAVDLEHALRVNIAAWGRHLHLHSDILEHQGAVTIVGFSPDGRTIATGSNDHTARLWDAASAEPIGGPLCHDGPVWCLAFSPDGRALATASRDGTARLWDSASATPIGVPMQHRDWVNALAFHPDGTVLATASGDGTARLWDVATTRPIGRPLAHQDMVYAVAFSPDGKMLTTAGRDKTARLWDVATATLIGKPLEHQDDVWAVVFNPDGRTVITGSHDKTVRVWDAAATELIGAPFCHRDRVFSVAISPDGRIAASATWDNTAWLWELGTGVLIGGPLRHAGQVNALAFSPDGRALATASGDGTARLWDVATATPLGAPLLHPDWVSSIAFSPDGRVLASGCGDSLARLWDLAGIAHGGSVLRQRYPVNGVAFSPDGRTLATACGELTTAEGGPSGGPGEARLWDVGAANPDRVSLPHHAAVRDVAFSADGKMVATASGDGTARLWEAATARPVGEPLRHDGRVDRVAFSPDGRALATASGDGTARLWDVATASAIGPPLRHRGWVNAVAFSPDGTMLATASDDRSVRLWDAATAQPLAEMLGHGDEVWRLAFMPDGSTIATGSRDRSVRLWDPRSATPHGRPLWHRGWVRALAFSPDGRTLATGGMENHVWLWDPSTGNSLGDPLRHDGSVEAIAFSPDGRTLATASEDGAARLWDVATARPIGGPLQHQRRVVAVAFSPDGRTLAVASGDGTARLWDIRAPIEGDVLRIALSTQLITNLEIGSGDIIRVLNAQIRDVRRRSLEDLGGPLSFRADLTYS